MANGFAFAVVDPFVLLSVVARFRRFQKLTAENLKNRVVSQNLVEVGNPVVVESLAEVEPLRLELPAMVAHFPLSLLSGIEGVFAVVECSVEQDEFAKAVVVVENRVAERPAEWGGFEMAAEVAENLVVERPAE